MHLISSTPVFYISVFTTKRPRCACVYKSKWPMWARSLVLLHHGALEGSSALQFGQLEGLQLPNEGRQSDRRKGFNPVTYFIC